MNKSAVLAFRRHFSAYDRQVFLAHCAQSPLSDVARAAVDALLDDYVTSGGVKFAAHLEVVARARVGVARLLGGDSADVAFIKNTSDGALLAADLLPLQAGDVVLVADCEFPANVIPFDLLTSRGVSVCRVPTPDHRPDMARFDEARAGRRGLVALDRELRRLALACQLGDREAQALHGLRLGVGGHLERFSDALALARQLLGLALVLGLDDLVQLFAPGAHDFNLGPSISCRPSCLCPS